MATMAVGTSASGGKRNTKVMRCSCVSAQQDNEYGEKMRVHNRAKGKTVNDVRWRCTVCGVTKEPSGDDSDSTPRA
ncbi:MAG: hypothetical protein E6R03_11310 [Hyphomicrobiaceae bacterium]|nr:MAG: hypothetical protein E6R03_11310 [Hyphomicrobiaceae bacterium]